MIHNVRILVGAHAYACIAHSAGNTDIRLTPGKGAPQSLREYAVEQRERAARALDMACLAEDAATTLEG